MNAVEIEQALSDLAAQPYDPAEFAYQFLAAFGNKDTALKRLRAGNNNSSDVPGGVLLRNNIHIATCEAGKTGETLAALRASAATTKGKVKFILATDGLMLEAGDLTGGPNDNVACKYPEFPDHFGFLLPLAGISTVQQIKDSPIDVRATGRLNKLYVELLKENPDWASEARRSDMNHFMSRLIFCFFAEDTDIFHGEGMFTRTVDTFSEKDGSNTHEVLSEIFRAMNVETSKRATANLSNWAEQFPYVNGNLFSGSTETPRFTRIALAYLREAGRLKWRDINPDIFGSMIQAVADEEERGALGLHYTSVPNILKVLNPLFLDDLRAQLDSAGDNKIKLLNLRKRMSRIRVFDPACGSGNFLVIAYKQMRAIEAEINKRRGETHQKSEIHLTNFRGIELRSFPAEIARLALIIAEFQCDVLYRGQKDALEEFLPLSAENWIVCGNALRLDWLGICPPTGTGVKVVADDLFETPLEQAEIDFANEGGETYICGNPPYLGSTWQTNEQKSDLQAIFDGQVKNWKSLDYVAGWFMKAANYGTKTPTTAAFVSTNSICQGQQVPILWPSIYQTGNQIEFAHTSFKWANLASHNAGVTVAIIGISTEASKSRRIYSLAEDGRALSKEVEHINAYLVPGQEVIVEKAMKPLTGISEMVFGSKPVDGGNLLLDRDELEALGLSTQDRSKYVRRIVGSEEFINGKQRYCLWIRDSDESVVRTHSKLGARIEAVKAMRLSSTKEATRKGADWPYRFDERRQSGEETVLVVAALSSENRDYLPCGLLPPGTIVSNLAFAVFDAPLWNLALIASRLHLVWVATVCGKLETRYRYSNTLGWNTFPVPLLTEQNKADLSASAQAILLARESHFPKTIADLYVPDSMPDNLRHAHEVNDEVLERIYIGRKFRNDTERLEKLFDLYTKMTDGAKRKPAAKKTTRRNT